MPCGPRIRLQRSSKDHYYNWNLRSARVEARYTSKKLAEVIGVSPAEITFYEHLVAWPPPDVAERIANVLGKREEDLFPTALREILPMIKIDRRNYPHRLGVEVVSIDRYVGNPLLVNNESLALAVENELRECADEALQKLGYRECEILKLMYGIGKKRHYTEEEICKHFKMSRQRVSQIKIRALRKMRDVRISGRLRSFLDA